MSLPNAAPTTKRSSRAASAAREVAVNIRAHARFTDAVLAACPDLKLISIWGVGTDNIDLAAAARRGVTVCNTPGANAYAVAEHAISLMLAVARKIPQIDREMRGGAWPREMLTQLCGKTLAVFGTGNIGARVAQLGRGTRHGSSHVERAQATRRRRKTTSCAARTWSRCTCGSRQSRAASSVSANSG